MQLRRDEREMIREATAEQLPGHFKQASAQINSAWRCVPVCVAYIHTHTHTYIHSYFGRCVLRFGEFCQPSLLVTPPSVSVFVACGGGVIFLFG